MPLRPGLQFIEYSAGDEGENCWNPRGKLQAVMEN